MRARGSSVLYALKQAGLNRQFKDADARGARAVIVIGPDEVSSGEVVIRDKTNNTEQRVQLRELTAAETT